MLRDRFMILVNVDMQCLSTHFSCFVGMISISYDSGAISK